MQESQEIKEWMEKLIVVAQRLNGIEVKGKQNVIGLGTSFQQLEEAIYAMGESAQRQELAEANTVESRENREDV